MFIQQLEWSGAGILLWNFLEHSADVIVTARKKGGPLYNWIFQLKKTGDLYKLPWPRFLSLVPLGDNDVSFTIWNSAAFCQMSWKVYEILDITCCLVIGINWNATNKKKSMKKVWVIFVGLLLWIWSGCIHIWWTYYFVKFCSILYMFLLYRHSNDDNSF